MKKVYQYIVQVLDDSGGIMGINILLSGANSQMDSLEDVRSQLESNGITSYRLELCQVQTVHALLEDLGYTIKMNSLKIPKIDNKPKNYEQLAQLMRDQGYVVYKKKTRTT